MKAIPLKISGAISLLVPLACLAVFGWKFSDRMARQKQDAALILGVKASRPPEVAAALWQGADANARDVPPDARTLWQRVQALFHGEAPQPAELKSALALAVKYDIAAQNAKERADSFAVLQMLHDRGAKPADAEKSADRRMAAAEAALRAAPDTPTARYGVDEFAAPDEKFSDALAARGLVAPAYRGLALCRFRAGKYAEAVHFYRVAQLWQADDRELAAKIAEAEEAQQIEAAIFAQRPRGATLTAARRFGGLPGRALWAALFGTKGEFGHHNIHVALYRQNGAAVQRLALSEMLSDLSYNDEPSDKHDFMEASLSVFRLTRRRLPELLITESTVAGSVEPTQFYVLEWRGGHFRRLFSQHSEWPFWIEKGRRGSAWIIRNEEETGADLAHCDRPRRCDFHTYNGDRYVFANAQYPGEFADYIQEASAALVKYPRDYDLLYNLAAFYRIRGQRRKSEECYRKALRSLRSKDAQYGDKSYYQRVLNRVPPGN